MLYDSLRTLDLNLLVTLDVLLRERNVTRSATKLGIGQPAASAALAKLRAHFDDELLFRTGRHYELTPLAAQLITHTGPALAGVRRVFEASTTFQPATADREFRLIVSDYTTTVLGEVLAQRLAAHAPKVHVRLEQTTSAAVDNAGELLKTVDGFLLPHGHIVAAESVELFTDEWVCVVSSDNRSVGDTVTRENLRDLPWVLTHDRAAAETPAARQLAKLGLNPTVVMVVETFVSVPFLIAGTPRIALMHRRLAERLAPVADIRVLPCPGRTEPFVQYLWWHPIFTHDPGHRWLRDELVSCGEQIENGTESARGRPTAGQARAARP